jgi:hypothetical protein
MTAVGIRWFVCAVSGNELRFSVKGYGFSCTFIGVKMSVGGCWGDRSRLVSTWMESCRLRTMFLDLAGSGTDKRLVCCVLAIGSKVIARWLRTERGIYWVTVFLSSLIFRSANLTSTSFSRNRSSNYFTWLVSCVISSMHYFNSYLNLEVIRPFLICVVSTYVSNL